MVAYCRVSTLEQKKKGYGIDIQIRDVTLFADLHNLFVQKFYKDERKKQQIEGLNRTEFIDYLPQKFIECGLFCFM